MKKQKILQLLEGMDRESELMTSDEVELVKEEYIELLEIMQESNLISGLVANRGGIGNKIISSNTNNVRITIKGIDYLEDNRSQL
jgi:hypothetical protein